MSNKALSTAEVFKLQLFAKHSTEKQKKAKQAKSTNPNTHERVLNKNFPKHTEAKRGQRYCFIAFLLNK